MQVDVRLEKTILFEPIRFSLFTTIDNLFDRVNPLVVDSRTGKPWETTLIGDEILFDQIHNPSRVDIPRIIRFGIHTEF